MNKQLNPNKFKELLSSTDNSQEPRQPQTINRAPFISERIESINRFTEENLRIRSETIKKTEEKIIRLRFKDLTEDAQTRFANQLKGDSSLFTVHNTPLWEIVDRLKLANPIIADNWGKQFCHGSFTRWRERKLSRVVYCLGRRYNGSEAQLRTVAYLLN